MTSDSARLEAIKANSARMNTGAFPVRSSDIDWLVERLEELLALLVKHRYGHKLVLSAEMTCCRYCFGDWNIHMGTTDCLPDCILSRFEEKK